MRGISLPRTDEVADLLKPLRLEQSLMAKL